MIQLSHYEEWRHCIEHICGIPLTAAFVKRRFQELSDPNGPDTQRFIKTWGEEHRQRVLGWFQQAGSEWGLELN
jgi:hypothetical protein